MSSTTCPLQTLFPKRSAAFFLRPRLLAIEGTPADRLYREMSNDLSLGQLLTRGIRTAFKVSEAGSPNDAAIQVSPPPPRADERW